MLWPAILDLLLHNDNQVLQGILGRREQIAVEGRCPDPWSGARSRYDAARRMRPLRHIPHGIRSARSVLHERMPSVALPAMADRTNWCVELASALARGVGWFIFGRWL